MLTARQKAFVNHFVIIRNAAAAARKAGYSPNGAKVTGCRLLTNANLKAALAEKEAELSRLADIDKNRVISEVIEGIELARQQANPGSIIAGWVHIAKMLGVYAPEVKNYALSAESEKLQSKFDALSDEQLLAIASGAAT